MNTVGIECRKSLEANLLSLEDLAAMLYKNSSGAFTKESLEKQKTGAISIQWTDSLMFDLLGNTSQCDYCGNVAVGIEGKMLSCGLPTGRLEKRTQDAMLQTKSTVQNTQSGLE